MITIVKLKISSCSSKNPSGEITQRELRERERERERERRKNVMR
jgi:hypothetical protein